MALWFGRPSEGRAEREKIFISKWRWRASGPEWSKTLTKMIDLAPKDGPEEPAPEQEPNMVPTWSQLGGVFFFSKQNGKS